MKQTAGLRQARQQAQRLAPTGALRKRTAIVAQAADAHASSNQQSSNGEPWWMSELRNPWDGSDHRTGPPRALLHAAVTSRERLAIARVEQTRSSLSTPTPGEGHGPVPWAIAASTLPIVGHH